MSRESSIPDKPARRLRYGLGLLGAVLVLGGWLAHGEVTGPRGGIIPDRNVGVVARQQVKPAAVGDPRRGAADPLVTIVQYSEFECPACQRVAAVLQDLVRRQPADVAVVWKDRPTAILRPRSPIAAKFARGVYESLGNDAFWRVHDELFRDLSRLRDADLVRVGSTLGFDTRRLLSAPAASIEERFAASSAEANALGIDATPALLVNGRRIDLARGDLGELVQRELSRARQLEQQGLTRDQVRMKLAAAGSPNEQEI